MPTDFTVTGLKYLLEVTDMDRAVAFYATTFGLEIAEQSEWWSELRLGQATVALHGGRKAGRVVTGLSFTVTDIDATTAAVRTAGGTVISEPYSPGQGAEGIRLAEYADPDDNTFMASQAL